MINIIGGVYKEVCVKPASNQIFGSGGRAGAAILNIGGDITLHAYIPESYLNKLSSIYRFTGGNFSIQDYKTEDEIIFKYNHGLDPFNPPITEQKPLIELIDDNILVFGTIEHHSKVKGEYVVYDPQNTFSTEPFNKYGSRAKHLALVLNENEARKLDNSTCIDDLNKIISSLHKKENAEVIIVKQGAQGSIVSYENKLYRVPAFMTETVSKIGSGDCFTAHFAFYWIERKLSPEKAAYEASRATAFFCDTSSLPTTFFLDTYRPNEIIYKHRKDKVKIYIAAPFFTLAQLWLVEQIRYNLLEMGMDVISPYHDIGLINNESLTLENMTEVCNSDLKAIDECQMVFAVLDGFDPGTIAEIGYAMANKKRITILSENIKQSDLTMFTSKSIVLERDYVTSIYKTLWASFEL
ncbi:nucleoside 2-deoxyribosyltransferase [Enterobacter asburiae]|uniref:PfkB family carbohydrate kinase n=1 Tax=Enterobacter cloacae complex TaxID=354276 RepID=UPI000649EBB5|nr:PfkB family carbohydrate kinase [Enterobacter asburiae]MCB7497807.1 PfkB family carbohydrate kinase [Enterobacter roggenkampii]AKK99564.1 hypothetical protein AB190_02855 [Enterobacter asburiae]ELP5720899.1 nucleoside 2-deoxyribosyltransferase [Enterobacter asburiae]MCU3444296.1 PfkB family carbohydrate kinase [Enterobacter asburiae]SAG96254.1 ADP-heptose synthase%2C bifunctional sugar kinase/adenylyltransferase [Enterobacter asburiae]